MKINFGKEELKKLENEINRIDCEVKHEILQQREKELRKIDLSSKEKIGTPINY